MGVERAVTRWHLQVQTIQQEITALQSSLEKIPVDAQTSSKQIEITQKIEDARQCILRLGPCPQAMMG